jgi:hypothetical protein
MLSGVTRRQYALDSRVGADPDRFCVVLDADDRPACSVVDAERGGVAAADHTVAHGERALTARERGTQPVFAG